MRIVELPDSEERFRSLVEIETVGVVFFDYLGGITDANEAFLRIIGYTRQELAAGAILYDELTPPEWQWRDAATLAELKATGQSKPFEKEYFRKDGSRIWILPAWNKPGQKVAKDARYQESRQRLLVHVAAEGFGCITRL